MRRGHRCLLQAFLAAALCFQGASKNISNKVFDRRGLQKEILEMFNSDMAVAMSRLAGLTYCGPDLDLKVVESCPECEDAGFEVVKGSVEELSLMTYVYKTYPDANYFLLGELQFSKSQDKACFVATRGTTKPVNWIQNGMQVFVDPKFVQCPMCRVHAGYFSVYEAAISKIKDYFDRHDCGTSESPIYFTGHSLGGATSSIFIAGLTSAGYKARGLATDVGSCHSCPLVALSYLLEPALAGNQAFSDYFRYTISKLHAPVPVFSLSNGWDMIPGFPSSLLKGYRRIPYDIHSDPSMGALTVCFHDGLDSDVCRPNINSWWYQKSLYIDHIVLWYAPGHFQYMKWVSEACKTNPNWFMLRLEWMEVGLYTFFMGSGVWNFAFKVSWTCLLCLSSVCCCFCCCCCREPFGYKVLPGEERKDLRSSLQILSADWD